MQITDYFNFFYGLIRFISNSNLESEDMLGDAYQYLIKQFADQGGKKGGEFYTPTEVVKILTNILKPQEGDRIYEPNLWFRWYAYSKYRIC